MKTGSSEASRLPSALSRLTVYSVLLSWVLLGLYIFAVTRSQGLDLGTLKYFVSIEQGGIKFRALLLLGPLLLTVLAYLINKEALSFHGALRAQAELSARTADLERINALLMRESTERRRAEEQLTRQAFHDHLTNLPNRSLLMDRLNAALEHKKRYGNYACAILFLDVDRFKIINDALGHTVGDQLLVLVSQRLKASIRAVDTVARVGGDEFIILMQDAKDISQVNKLAERIETDMRLPFSVLGRQLFAAVSIGIVLSEPGDHRSAVELIRDADIAMYQAKARGKACHVVFDVSLHAEAMSALGLETDLRAALGNNELLIHYQPIISMEQNRLIGMEALVRWQHATRGLLRPLDFMMVAEDSGLILPIGRWVVREACRQLRQWQDQYASHRELTVSVNVAGKVFAESDFYDVVAEILRDAGLEARYLRLEIVERTLIDNPEPAAVLLKKLRELGVRIDIDDFGTGYSALNYLRHFPIHGLKIDRSFMAALTTDRKSAAIVKTIIALSHDLNLDVTAEGIETVEQMEAYRAMRGGYAQGFFISRPVECKTMEDLLSGARRLGHEGA